MVMRRVGRHSSLEVHAALFPQGESPRPIVETRSRVRAYIQRKHGSLACSALMKAKAHSAVVRLVVPRDDGLARPTPSPILNNRLHSTRDARSSSVALKSQAGRERYSLL
jgi:hypothetical protein